MKRNNRIALGHEYRRRIQPHHAIRRRFRAIGELVTNRLWQVVHCDSTFADWTQKTTCYMLQRIKEACGNKCKVLAGIVEADEKYVGGRESNKHELKKGPETVGKQPVPGLKERDGEVLATPIETVDADTIHKMFHSHVRTGSVVHTNEHAAYAGLEGLFYQHESVNHGAKEYVSDTMCTPTP